MKRGRVVMHLNQTGLDIKNLKFHSAPRNEIRMILGGTLTIEEVKKLIFNLPESNDIPDKFIENIAKIAIQQNKISNIPWILKMLGDARKKHSQALVHKNQKLLKNQTVKKDEFENRSKVKSKILLFKKDKLEYKLPYVKNLRNKYPKLSNITWYYILENYGQWPLIVMSIFNDRDKLYPQWTVQCAAALSGIGLKTILELNLHENSDELYRYLKENGNFKNYHEHRIKYIDFIKKIKNQTIKKGETL